MLCSKYNINISNDFSLENVLSDPVEIRQWTTKFGLPADSLSKENGIMFKYNKKHPLMIDPQLQGNQWLKQMYKNKMTIIKADVKDEKEKKQLDSIGIDIMKGNYVLVENISRRATMNDSIYQQIISKIKEKVFDISKIKLTKQK